MTAPPRHRPRRPVPRRTPPRRPSPQARPPPPTATHTRTAPIFTPTHNEATFPTHPQPAPASASPTGTSLLSRSSPRRQNTTAGPAPQHRTAPPSTRPSHTGTYKHAHRAQPRLHRVCCTLTPAHHAHTRTHTQSLTHNTPRLCTPARTAPRVTPPHPPSATPRRPPRKQARTPLTFAWTHMGDGHGTTATWSMATTLPATTTLTPTDTTGLPQTPQQT